MFKLEDNVEVPKIERTKKYPFEQMDVGQSFAAEGTKIESLRSVAYTASKRTGHKYSVRMHEGQPRVWRVK